MRNRFGLLVLVCFSVLAGNDLYAQSHIGFSNNIFLESFAEGEAGTIETANINSYSLRYARTNMFLELRLQRFNINDNPRWNDIGILTYDSTSHSVYVIGGNMNSVGQQNEFTLDYVSLIIGPRFELLKHLAYEIGTSVDYLIHKSTHYANFENNPYLIPNAGNTLWNIQELNIRFYNRVQAWYDVTDKWRISTYWEFNTPITNELIDAQQFDTNSGKSVRIEPIKNGAQFFLNFMIEYKL